MMDKINNIEVSVAEVVDYLKITGQFAPALRAVVERKLAADAARNRGIKITTSQLQKAADTFRAAYGLNKATETESWLLSIGVSAETFEEYLETNLLVNKFKEELGKKANKAKYLSSPGLKESMKEFMYQDWLSAQLR
jgi:hypothetical protein